MKPRILTVRRFWAEQGSCDVFVSIDYYSSISYNLRQQVQMRTTFRFLIREYHSLCRSANSHRIQCLQGHTEEEIERVLRELFPGEVSVQRIKELLMEYGQCYENEELKEFLIDNFGEGKEVSVGRFVTLLAKGIEGQLYAGFNSGSYLSLIHDMVCLINEMVGASVHINKLKERFRLQYEIEELFRHISQSDRVISTEKVLEYSQRREDEVAEFLKMVEVGKLKSLESLMRFFRAEPTKEEIRVQGCPLPPSLHGSVKEKQVSDYLTRCISELEKVEQVKQRLISSTCVTYQNIYLVFSFSVDRRVSLKQAMQKYSQFEDRASEGRLRNVFLRYGHDLHLDLDSIKTWMSPRSQTWRRVLERRELASLKSKELSQLLDFLSLVLEVETTLNSIKISNTGFVDLFQAVDTDGDGVISPDDLRKFLSRRGVKCSQKQLMLLMFRFTSQYESTKVNYSQFIRELQGFF